MGEQAGCFDNKGYVIIRLNKKGYKAHRLAFLWMTGQFPKKNVDHIDRVKSNNAWTNLRELSCSGNSRNIGKTKRNKSGVVGVCWIKSDSKWRASFRYSKDKCTYIGQYDNFLDAVKARWEMEKHYNYNRDNRKSSAYGYLKQQNIAC